MEKIELGPLQTKWVEDLENYPDRQITGTLGFKTPEGELKLCCLGHGIISCGIDSRFDKLGRLTCEGKNEDRSLLTIEAADELGLKSISGHMSGPALCEHHTLSEANDAGVSWIEIAKYIRENPESVFTKSV